MFCAVQGCMCMRHAWHAMHGGLLACQHRPRALNGAVASEQRKSYVCLSE